MVKFYLNLWDMWMAYVIFIIFWFSGHKKDLAQQNFLIFSVFESWMDVVFTVWIDNLNCMWFQLCEIQLLLILHCMCLIPCEILFLLFCKENRAKPHRGSKVPQQSNQLQRRRFDNDIFIFLQIAVSRVSLLMPIKFCQSFSKSWANQINRL